MLLKLDSRKADFQADFTRLVDERRESEGDVSRDVSAIIADVKKRGDVAIAELTQKFDRHDLNKGGWQLTQEEIKKACDSLPSELMDALKLAATRIRYCHENQLPESSEMTDAAGVRMGVRWQAVEAAGLYVPGGRAAYCSSVLMNAVPAKVAGVKRLVMVTPTPDGFVNPAVIAAAVISEVDEIWKIGGAQAVAALALGTEKIKPVDVVVGPGNAWVAEAKRQLYGQVGIDMVAGPSEIVVVADKDNDPEWLAADLLSQAEHDPTSQSILISDSEDLIEKTIEAVGRRLEKLETQKVAAKAGTNTAPLFWCSLWMKPLLWLTVWHRNILNWRWPILMLYLPMCTTLVRSSLAVIRRKPSAIMLVARTMFCQPVVVRASLLDCRLSTL